MKQMKFKARQLRFTSCFAFELGSPMPKATWRKNGSPLQGAQTDQSPDFCKVKLKAVKRPDCGEYELELTNDCGTVKVPITLKVIGKYRTKLSNTMHSVTAHRRAITKKVCVKLYDCTSSCDFLPPPLVHTLVPVQLDFVIF